MTQVQTLNRAICISFCTNAFGKDIKLYPPLMSKLLGRLGSLNFDRQPVQEKESSKFKSTLLCLKINPLPHSTCGGGDG